MTVGPLRITADEVNCLIYAYFQDAGLKHSAFSILHEGHLKDSPYMSRHIPRGELIDLLGKALLYHEVESHWRNDSLTINCKTGFSLLEPHVCSIDTSSAKPGPASSIVADTQRIPVVSNAPPAKLHPPPTTSNNHSQQQSIPQQKPTASSSKETAPQKAVVHKAPTAAPSISSAALTLESGNKRKVSPVPLDGAQEKRARRDPDAMVVDSQPEVTKPNLPIIEPPPSSRIILPETQSKKPGKVKPRAQGPGDDLTDPRSVLLLPGHKTEVFVCAFNPVHYELLATGSKDATVKLWNLPRPQRVNEFASSPTPPIVINNFSKTSQGDLTSLHWNSDGSLLAIGSYDSVVRICTREGKVYFSQVQHEGPIFATRFSKSGRWLLTASLDGTTCLWDVHEKKLYSQYRCHKDCCLDVDWLNEDSFASAGADMRINIMRIGENEPIKVLEGHEDEINQIRVNPTGTRLASCSDDTTTRIWRIDNISSTADTIPGLASSDNVVVLGGHKHSVSTVAWCPKTVAGTHELIATASFDGTARLWDSVTGQCLHIFSDHKRPVYALAFSPNGNFLATGSGDGWLYIYNAKTHEKKWSWFAGSDRPGVFEIDWQNQDGVNRIALALECRQVGVIDVSKLASLETPEYLSGLTEVMPSTSSVEDAKAV